MIKKILAVVLPAFLLSCQGGQDAKPFQHPVFRAARVACPELDALWPEWRLMRVGDLAELLSEKGIATKRPLALRAATDDACAFVPACAFAPVSQDAPAPQRVYGDSSECCLCMDQPADAVFVPCGHAVFCAPCAKRSLGAKRRCALCRQRVDEVSMRAVAV